MKKKDFIDHITSITESDPIDFDSLYKIIRKYPYGLKYTKFRAKIWPILLGFPSIPDTISFKSLRKARSRRLTDHEKTSISQITKDVNRSLWKFKKTIFKSDSEFEYRRKQLQRLLECIVIPSLSSDNSESSSINKFKDLFYFQGLHDVFSIFLIVCGEYTSSKILKNLVDFYFHDFVHTNEMTKSTNVLKLINIIVSFENKKLSNVFKATKLDGGDYAISWILTWYSYNIEDFKLICRLFDLFLVSHPLLPVYVAASYVLHKKKEILSSKCDFSEIFQKISKFQVNDDIKLKKLKVKQSKRAAREAKKAKGNVKNLDEIFKKERKKTIRVIYEKIIQDSLILLKKHPPEKITSGVNFEITDYFLHRYPYTYLQNTIKSSKSIIREKGIKDIKNGKKLSIKEKVQKQFRKRYKIDNILQIVFISIVVLILSIIYAIYTFT